MRKSTKFVALDIYKDSITVALAGEDRQGPKLYGTIPSTDAALSKPSIGTYSRRSKRDRRNRAVQTDPRR